MPEVKLSTHLPLVAPISMDERVRQAYVDGARDGVGAGYVDGWERGFDAGVEDAEDNQCTWPTCTCEVTCTERNDDDS